MNFLFQLELVIMFLKVKSICFCSETEVLLRVDLKDVTDPDITIGNSILDNSINNIFNIHFSVSI